MLDFVVSQNPWRFGLAEGTDPHQVPPGTLTTAENVVCTKSGRWDKRRGTSLLSKTVDATSAAAWGTSTTIGAAKRLLTRGNELCLIDGSNLYAYSPDV